VGRIASGNIDRQEASDDAQECLSTCHQGRARKRLAFWLEALLLAEGNGAALEGELALLALGPGLPSGESALALDLLLAGLASGTTA
jgi:hypothetical protein